MRTLGNMIDASGSTDMGPAHRGRSEIGLDGGDCVAYVTGEPEAPDLRAYFFDHLSCFFRLELDMELLTERKERKQIDHRAYSTNALASPVFYFPAAWGGEAVGGTNVLRYTMTDLTLSGGGRSQTYTNWFLVRGKNAMDGEVSPFICDTVDPALTNIAVYIAMIESKQNVAVENGKQVWRVYNQFNSYNYTNTVTGAYALAGWPNRSSDSNGWGIAQITMPNAPTAVVWNWMTNIVFMGEILDDKRRIHNICMEVFEDAYIAI